MAFKKGQATPKEVYIIMAAAAVVSMILGLAGVQFFVFGNFKKYPVKTEAARTETVITSPTSMPNVVLGSGVVSAIDRSDETLRDAGLEIVQVKTYGLRTRHHPVPTKIWLVTAPMAMAFQVGDRVDLVKHVSSDSDTVIAIRRPLITK